MQGKVSTEVHTDARLALEVDVLDAQRKKIALLELGFIDVLAHEAGVDECGRNRPQI